MSEDKIQWHPAFADAMELELRNYESAFTIQTELQLTAKPLEIDVLVVKKAKDIEITKNIAQMFRAHNIIEYKSPEDYLSIDDYYKTMAYAYLYKVGSDTVNGIGIGDLTITMVSSAFPRKLGRHLTEELGYEVHLQEQGIYYIYGGTLPTQLIIVDELPGKVNRFIRLLTKKADIRDEIAQFYKEYIQNMKDSRYEHLAEILENTNLNTILEVIEMARQLSPEEQIKLEKVAEKFKLKDKWLNEGKLEGKLDGKLEVARQLLLAGSELEFVIKVTGISEEEIRKILDSM